MPFIFCVLKIIPRLKSVFTSPTQSTSITEGTRVLLQAHFLLDCNVILKSVCCGLSALRTALSCHFNVVFQRGWQSKRCVSTRQSRSLSRLLYSWKYELFYAFIRGNNKYFVRTYLIELQVADTFFFVKTHNLDHSSGFEITKFQNWRREWRISG